MEIKEVQTLLKAKKLYDGVVDGQIGKGSRGGIDTYLKSKGVKIGDWTDARRVIAFEQEVYKEAGIEVGSVDGLIGEQTRYARTVWEAKKNGTEKAVTTWRDEDKGSIPAAAPPNVTAKKEWPRQSGVTAFFGSPGDGSKQTSLVLPFPMKIAWEPATVVHKITCHKLVAESLTNIWQNTLSHYGHEQIEALRLDMFGGCLNVRKMRGGSAWSMHSWGIAVDIDPDRNQLKYTRDKATLDDAPYKKFWEFVYAEGAIGLGIERNYDWMHFQFARL